ncbi:MAG: hypothetical protein BWY78_00457 [Alphaproteobacteria bacterium ADurb.Bin438]|nr:MAG: hypothetical protein BWY78_00457 [Alphaproteobacteria bacterium ADurb.Bin438]
MASKKQKKASSFRFFPYIIVGIASLLVVKVANVVDFIESHNKSFEVVKEAYSETSNDENHNKNDQSYKEIANSKRSVNNEIGKEYSQISQGELEVLGQLAKRRELLELREKEVEQRMALLSAAESQLDIKINQLKALQKSIEDLVVKKESKDSQNLENLIKIYSNMKPKDAARIFDELEMDILINIFSNMREQKSSAILAVMNPAKANALTVELAKPKPLPFDKNKIK